MGDAAADQGGWVDGQKMFCEFDLEGGKMPVRRRSKNLVRRNFQILFASFPKVIALKERPPEIRWGPQWGAGAGGAVGKSQGGKQGLEIDDKGTPVDIQKLFATTNDQSFLPKVMLSPARQAQHDMLALDLGPTPLGFAGSMLRLCELECKASPHPVHIRVEMEMAYCPSSTGDQCGG